MEKPAHKEEVTQGLPKSRENPAEVDRQGRTEGRFRESGCSETHVEEIPSEEQSDTAPQIAPDVVTEFFRREDRTCVRDRNM